MRLIGLRFAVGDDHIVLGGSGQLASVARLLLQATYEDALRNGAHCKYMADAELGLLATVCELTNMDALSCEEQLCFLHW